MCVGVCVCVWVGVCRCMCVWVCGCVCVCVCVYMYHVTVLNYECMLYNQIKSKSNVFIIHKVDMKISFNDLGRA